MSGDRPTLVLHEAIVGTSDGVPRLQAVQREQHSLADVERHMQTLRAVLRGSAKDPGRGEGGAACAASLPASSLFPLSPIAAVELDRIQHICDALDTVHYWAVEEGSTYREESSILVQADAPEAVCAALLSRRPRVVAAALQVAQHMSHHPQATSEMARVAFEQRHLVRPNDPAPDGVDVRDGTVGTAPEPSSGSAGDRCTSLMNLLAETMRRHPAALDVVTAATRTAAALASSSSSAAPVAFQTAAPFLDSDVIAEVLAAMERHTAHTPLAAAAVHFFASVVRLPRGGAVDAVGYPTPEPPPVALLVCHVGCIPQYLCDALLRHPHHTGIQRDAMEFIRTCAALPQNRVRLMQCGAYAATISLLRGDAPLEDSLLHVAAEAASAFVPLLDAYQRRSFVLRVKSMLSSRGSLVTQHVALALLSALLIAMERDGSTSFTDARPRRDPFRAYSLYPRPPSPGGAGEASAVVADPERAAAAIDRRHVRLLRITDELPTPPLGDTMSFIHEVCVPQLVLHVADYYRRALCALRGEDGGVADALPIERVQTLATDCVGRMLATDCVGRCEPPRGNDGCPPRVRRDMNV